MRGETNQCDAQTECFVRTSLQPFRLVVLSCGMMSGGWLRGEMKQCGELWGDERGGNVLPCEMSCHVWWCDVASRHHIWCDVKWYHVMWCALMWCDAMRWNVMRLWWDVVSCYVMRSVCVIWWNGRWCAVNFGGLMSEYYHSELQNTTQYYL